MEILFTKTKLRSNIKTLSDVEKVKAIYTRDEELTRKIYLFYRDEFINFLRKIHNGEKEVLLDIYSDAFCLVCDKIYFKKLTLTSSLKTYLFGIGKNMMMDYLRKKNRRLETYQSELKNIPSEESYNNVESEKIVKEGLVQLGEPCYSLLTMKFWYGMSGEEMAGELNFKNADVVKTRRYKCIQQLRKKIENRIIYN